MMTTIDDLIQPFIDPQKILGAAVALLQDGEIVYQGGFGTTSIADKGLPVTPLTLFPYGSICKTICATLIMRLVERNLLQLDRPVVDYLPDLQFSHAAYGQKVNLRHLLSHTSGLPMAGKYWGPRDPDSLRRFVYEQIPQYSFLTEPGTVHLYSNTVFCIAGHIAEAVTGRYYDDLVQETIFDPLQMVRSTYDPVVAMTYPLALPHRPGPDGALQVIHRMTYNVSGNPSSFAYGSVSDLTNLAQMFLNQGHFGGQGFLTAESIAEMQTLHGKRHISGADHPIVHTYQGYGLGFMVGEYKGKRVVKHGGQNLSNNCFFELFPDKKAGVLLFANYGNEDSLLALWATLYDYVLDLSRQGVVLIGKPAPIARPLDGKQLQRYKGTYLNVESATLATISVVDDELILERQGNPTPLIAFEVDKFYGEYGANRRMPVEFLLDSEEKTICMMIWGQPYYPLKLSAGFQPDWQLWQSFAGLYKDLSNTNRDEIFAVRIQDEQLFIAMGNREVPGQALNNRTFLSDFGLIEFEDTAAEALKVLVWGKATHYYPLNQTDYGTKGVVNYLLDNPRG